MNRFCIYIKQVLFEVDVLGAKIMKKWKRLNLLVIVTLFIAVVIGVIFFYAAVWNSNDFWVNKRISVKKLETLVGKEYRVRDYKLSVIYCFSPTALHDEMDMFKDIFDHQAVDKTGNVRLVALTSAVDSDVDAFLKERNIGFPISNVDVERIPVPFRNPLTSSTVTFCCTTYFINEKGILEGYLERGFTEDELRLLLLNKNDSVFPDYTAY